MITEQEEESLYSRRFILILITIATFLNPFTGTAVNLALPAIGAEFSADATTLAWISSAYLLASVIFLLPAGRLGDSRGRVTVFMTGIVVYTAGTILAVFTPTIGMLLLFRFIQGIGGAMLYANSMALITHLYPPGERGYAIGLNITAVYAALSPRAVSWGHPDPVLRLAEHLYRDCVHRCPGSLLWRQVPGIPQRSAP
jgi:MFS family permease